MDKSFMCIMLIDDSDDDNYFHKREILKMNPDHVLIILNSGEDALVYLSSQTDIKPDLIFLDINMPGMDGWEFLDKYQQLTKENQCKTLIIMLTTSENPDDVARAMKCEMVSEYISKPLTRKIVENVCHKYFNYS